MAHSPKPFFRTARNAWYVQLGSKQTKLFDGPKTPRHREIGVVGVPCPDGLAELCQLCCPGIVPEFWCPFCALSLAELFEKFLDWCQKHREPRTYDDYVWHLQRFVDHLKAKKNPATGMAALDLRPFHVNEGLDAQRHPPHRKSTSPRTRTCRG
ncbi:hypothetical protein [Limnoglobus roseus]|uniref:Site-specific integrase n=1 Tax=Limnoglobus roseus TaxID=2598579 RepID=A0A5C1AJ30_9BACT|nr:hypothetical protein [Limnoglobus roseus]QEL19171.1 site-specific integrase [Limnoglobus roseus]